MKTKVKEEGIKAVRFESALESYESKQEQIRKLLKQIEAGLEAHDKRASQKVGGHNWGDVGDLGSIEEVLTDVKDKLHLTGEYAQRATLT